MTKEREIPMFNPTRPADMPKKNMALDREMWAGAPEITPRPGDTQLATRQVDEGRVTPARRPDNLDVDAAMWTGYTPTPRREMPEAPPKARQQFIPTSRKLPSTRPPFFPLFGTKVCPPNQCPDVWSIPVHEVQEDCITYYETEYTVYKYTADATRLFVLEEVGYEFERDKFPIGHVLVIRVKRDGEVMAEWEEYVADNTPNPAKRYTFGSILHPVPCPVRVDKNQTLTITVTAKGPLPFSKTDADLLVGNAKVLGYGYLAQLRDTRDGSFKSRVDGSETDRSRHVMQSIIDYQMAFPELLPYYTERFNDDPMTPFYEEAGQEDY